MPTRRTILAAPLALAAAPAAAHGAPPKRAVLSIYADIAGAMYADALAGARVMQAAIARLVEAPSEATLAEARCAWIAARVPYQQTEGYRRG